jgi:hypothetical protein
MSHDDPKITAYVLGECDEPFQLDADALSIARQTALIATVLSTHLRKSRRRIRLLPQAIAASLLLLVLASPARQLIHTPVPQPQIARADDHDAPILRLTPTVMSDPYSPKIDQPLDVDQLVAGVLQDASRVTTFASLRLTADSPEALFALQ